MSKVKRFLTSPAVSLAAFAAAAGLLLFSSVGGARAALTYYSETYSSRVQMYDIGITLRENGEDVSWRNYSGSGGSSESAATGRLLEKMLENEGETTVKPGKIYTEELSVANSGTINQYVRVSIYKYWTNGSEESEEKLQNLSPDMIGLNLVNSGDWIVDPDASTDERTVLYYTRVLNSGEESPLFADSITIDGSVVYRVTQTENDGLVTTVYDYDDVEFCLEVKVDAVQEHNAQDAIWSSWGRRVTVNDGTLSLN